MGCRDISSNSLRLIERAVAVGNSSSSPLGSYEHGSRYGGHWQQSPDCSQFVVVPHTTTFKGAKRLTHIPCELATTTSVCSRTHLPYSHAKFHIAWLHGLHCITRRPVQAYPGHVTVCYRPKSFRFASIGKSNNLDLVRGGIATSRDSRLGDYNHCTMFIIRPPGGTNWNQSAKRGSNVL